MHLLYLDESGTVSDPSQKFFVLAGLSVFERKTHWVEEQIDTIAARFSQADPYSIELHGSPMRSGRDEWKIFPRADREKAIEDSLKVIANNIGVRLFGVVLLKSAFPGQNAAELAFEQIAARFDTFLRRCYLNADPQRGLILFDKSSTERRIQTLAREFKHTGHTWGKTKNYADVPVFLDSKASRLIQMADLVAYALFRKYEYQDTKYFDIIKESFDNDGGVQHGLCIRLV